MKRVIVLFATIVLIFISQVVIAGDLGNLSSNPFNPKSTSNPFRAGDPFNPNSINNPYRSG